MTEYIVAAAALGVPTGKENPLTRLPDVVRFVRGDKVDSAKFDTEAGRNKIERLLQQGALRDPEDIPQEAKVAYASDFDIPLDRDPGGTAKEQGVVRLPGDDIEDADDDDSEPPVFAEPGAGQAGVPVTTGLASQEVQVPPASAPVETETDQTGSGDEESGSDVPAPPSRGASTAVWQQFAEQIKLGTNPDAGRSEIQEAYDAKYSNQG